MTNPAVDTWRARCRAVERLGFDAILVPDHLGIMAPFPAGVAAAAPTERVRVGSLVLNAAFHVPALLARDVAWTDGLTGGRFELGLGAGHLRSEFEDAGVPWRTAADRTEHLRRTIIEVTDRIAALDLRRPPLLVGGNSDGVLRIAAEHADIVGFTGLIRARGGGLRPVDARTMDERVAFVRAARGGSDHESTILIQDVTVTDDPMAAAAAWTERVPDVDVAELPSAPSFLFGTVDGIARELHVRRDRYGFSYVTVFEQVMEPFAEVIATLSRP
jgi:probable F420-dependent oxidoreductase